MNRQISSIWILTLFLCSFGFLSAQTPGWSWVNRLETETQNAYPREAVADATGNIFTMWSIDGPCCLGFPEIPAIPSNDTTWRSYISKQSSDGSFIWVKQIETTSINMGNLGSYGAGYLYFTAYFWGTVTLGGFTLTSPGIAGRLIAKLDAEGDYLWVKDISGIGSWYDFSVGPNGYCFFTGSFDGTISFDDITLTCSGQDDMFIARLTPEGSWMWARQASGTGNVGGKFLAAGSNGDCYIAGTASQDVTLEDIHLNRPWDDYGWTFVAKYNQFGVCQWADQLYSTNTSNYDISTVDLAEDGLGNAYALYEFWDHVSDYTCLKVRKFTGSNYMDVFISNNSGDVRAKSLAIDAQRNLYILGQHYSPVWIEGIQLPSEEGALVVKLDSNCNMSWVIDPSPGTYSRYRQIGVTSDGVPYLLLSTYSAYPVGGFVTNPWVSAGYIAGVSTGGGISWLESTWVNYYSSQGTDICQLSSGENFVCGNYQGAFVRPDAAYPCFGTGGNDIYVAGLTNSGAWLWTNVAGGEGNDEVNAIVTDTSQNSYITGSYSGTMHFGDLTITANGETDIFVAKLDNQGAWLWAETFGGSGSDSGADLVLDAAGNLCVTGTYTGTVNFTCGEVTSQGLSDIFVLKLDNSGTPLAAVSGGGAGDDTGTGIVSTPDLHYAICGSFDAMATFGSNTVNTTGETDILLARLDGNLVWLSTAVAGGADADSVAGIGTDVEGNLYLTGYFTDTAQFGGLELQSLGGKDVFVAKADLGNSWQWAQTCGSSADDAALAIAVTQAGMCYITGYASEDFHYGQQVIQSYGAKDILCAALQPEGSWIWAKLTGSYIENNNNLDDVGQGVTVNAGGNCTVTGFFTGEVHFGPTDLLPRGANETFISTLISGVDNDDSTQSISTISKISAFPNPFSDKTHVSYEISKTADISLEIYNIKGQLVKRLVNDTKPTGKYAVDWDGTDNKGVNCSIGVYFCRIRTNDKTLVRKMTKLLLVE